MTDGGRDLPSSGEVVLGKGQVPCEFQADQTKHLVFMGEVETWVLKQGPAQDGALSLAGGSGM